MIESPKNLKTLTERVATTFPGIELFVLDHFNGINSFKAMKKQHDVFKADLVKIMKNYPEGINLLGYSQGTVNSQAPARTYNPQAPVSPCAAISVTNTLP